MRGRQEVIPLNEDIETGADEPPLSLPPQPSVSQDGPPEAEVQRAWHRIMAILLHQWILLAHFVTSVVGMY